MAMLGALEALRSGTTLVLEDGAGTGDYASALAGTGMRFLLGVRAFDRSAPRSATLRPTSSTGRWANATSGSSRTRSTNGTARPMDACASPSRPGRRTCARPSC